MWCGGHVASAEPERAWGGLEAGVDARTQRRKEPHGDRVGVDRAVPR